VVEAVSLRKRAEDPHSHWLPRSVTPHAQLAFAGASPNRTLGTKKQPPPRTSPREPCLLPRVQHDLADFPMADARITSKPFQLENLMRIAVRSRHRVFIGSEEICKTRVLFHGGIRVHATQQ